MNSLSDKPNWDNFCVLSCVERVICFSKHHQCVTLLVTLRDEESFSPLFGISRQRTLGNAQLVYNIKTQWNWISFEWDVIWVTANILLNAVLDESWQVCKILMLTAVNKCFKMQNFSYKNQPYLINDGLYGETGIWRKCYLMLHIMILYVGWMYSKC